MTENMKEVKSRFTMDGSLKLIQLLALIVAGIWTIYTYVTFQKGQQQLSLEQQQISKEQDGLSLEQNKLLADTRSKTEQVSLKQEEFKLAQDTLLADTQKDTAQTSLKQQKFTLEQNTLLAGTQRDIARISRDQQKFSLAQQQLTADSAVRSAKSETTIKESQADAARQNPFKLEVKGKLDKVKINEKGIGEYKLELSLSIKNLSEKRIHISAARAGIYIGKYDETPIPNSAQRLNNPGTTGVIIWELAKPEVFFISPAVKYAKDDRYDCQEFYSSYTEEDVKKDTQKATQTGGFAYGELQRLQTYSGKFDFKITTFQRGWVGYTLLIVTDDCKTGQNFTRMEYFDLSEIK